MDEVYGDAYTERRGGVYLKVWDLIMGRTGD